MTLSDGSQLTLNTQTAVEVQFTDAERAVRLTADHQGESVRAADVARLTSWLHGRVIFESTRLADAVAELNRYSQTKIELADPALADLRLSGGFATGHPKVFIEAVTTYFPIQVLRADEGLKKPAEP